MFYSNFRRVFPIFGPDVTSVFIKFCKENEFEVEKCLDESDKTIAKLFMCSKLTKAHYKACGIVDATYRQININSLLLSLVV